MNPDIKHAQSIQSVIKAAMLTQWAFATKNVDQPSNNDAFKQLGIDSMLLHPVP